MVFVVSSLNSSIVLYSIRFIFQYLHYQMVRVGLSSKLLKRAQRSPKSVVVKHSGLIFTYDLVEVKNPTPALPMSGSIWMIRNFQFC